MNTLLLAALSGLLAVSYAAPSGLGAIVAGPSGVVTGLGPIGPAGHGWGWGQPVAIAAPAVVAAPVVTARLDYGLGYGHGVAAVTAGGGSISASGHGAVIRGPPTAPVVVAGPAGKIAADGLWGPTANIGGHGAFGAVGNVGIAQGHGWW
ncbi:hypothetical protein WA026_009552 [Henosepilachna vigintioctopunctata]|uniref:Uncharacterized protein n=1 Tax=Henosepilachna vigintioctopunctata TaxID=420089 RepID=A0AAW1TZQ7_9CUCU